MNHYFSDQLRALKAFLGDAQKVLGRFHPDLWLFWQREVKIEAEEMIETASNRLGVTHSLFLTDRGLTMYFRLEKDGLMSVWIGGWGCNEAPETYLVLTMLLRKHELVPAKYYNWRLGPLGDEWLDKYFADFDPYVWLWVRENSHLLP